MPKQRMTTADVVSEVACIRKTCLGMRVANIYDLDSKTYLLKLQKSGEDGFKTFLVLESGQRFHTTQTLKERKDAPSNFTLKLRKHIRTRRLEDVRQLGVDRIVDFSFGTGEATYHIILEMYSQGNVILTDGRYEVLTLLRSHRDDARGIATMPRHPYPLNSIRLAQPVTSEVLQAAVSGADDADTLRSVLTSVLLYGPLVADHCLLSAGLQPGAKVSEAMISQEQQETLLKEIGKFEAWLKQCADAPPTGYIILTKPGESRKQRAAAAAAAGPPPGSQQQAAVGGPENGEGLVFSEFEPMAWAQNVGRPSREFATFDGALDEFYSKVEGQRVEVAQQAATKAALSKLDKVRNDITSRAEALGQEADAEEDRALLIEYNMADVDAAINALNAALARGLDWRELGALIEAEKRAGNPVAALVGKLALERNSATLLLRNTLDEEVDSDEEDAPPPQPTPVEVDLGMNAAANARARHEVRKKAVVKQRKTVEANAKALAAAEQKTASTLAQVAAKAVRTRDVRTAAWFERFAWFVSSENCLVLSARDSQQADLLIKRHMKLGDIFVHADLQGAPVTIIKRPDPASPVPPLSISQAGAACVCNSAAWDAKVVTSAWWCPADQVSTTDSTGAELPAGTVNVRGAKQFLPPTPLVMGLAFLFVLDEASAARHAGERAAKSAGATDTAAETDAAAAADDQNVAGHAAQEERDAAAGSSWEPKSDTEDAEQSEQPDAVGAAAEEVAAASLEEAGCGGGGDSGDSSNSASAAPDLQGAAEEGGGGALASSSFGGMPDKGRVESSALSRKDSMDRRPGIQRNLQLSGSSALDAFMDGSADPNRFSRYGLEAQPSAVSAVTGPEGVSVPMSPVPDPAAAEEIRQAVVDGSPPARRHLSAAARRAARKQGLTPGAVLPPAAARVAADRMESLLARTAAPDGGSVLEPPAQPQAQPQGPTASSADSQDAAEQQQQQQQQPAGSGDGRSSSGGEGDCCRKSGRGDDPLEAARAAERDRVAAKQEQAQRGKAAKLKKAKAKYADQDEGDRAFAMAALASAGGKKEKGDKKQARKARRDARRGPEAAAAPLPTTEQLQAVNARPVREKRVWGHEARKAAAAEQNSSDAAVPALQRLQAMADAAAVADAGDAAQATGSAAAAAAEMQGEEGAAEAEDAEEAGRRERREAEADAQRLQLLHVMTGMPMDDDVILHALPVCAPYAVLARYRYKAKLTPGSQKRGKAARQVVELLARNAPEKHAEAMRTVPEPDAIAACRGGVKVSIPGMQAAKAAAKSKKKVK